jgi:tRNA-specific 2-thiouridylase
VNDALLEEYMLDVTRRGPAAPDAWSGASGGAPCGDLVRVSFGVESGALTNVTFDVEGCAAARAAAAAVAELADGADVLDVALISSQDVAAALGGLGPQGRHAAELAADALHRALSAVAAAGETLVAPPARGERVLVALSGGVDSAVAALLERERGAEVVAVTVKLWADRANDGERSCCSPEAVLGARALAHSLGIPHLTLDLREAFRAGVVERFLSGYAAGETPNPCVVCNGDLRLDAMVALAERLGAPALATGHYARLVDDGEGPLLTAAADAAKDQTYMLAGVRPQTLAALRFPLAGLRKPEVRELAARAGLPVAAKRESQDLCFLAGEGKRAFLERNGALDAREGELVDTSGRVLGLHPGHQNFTIGQRRGIGIGSAEPLYVLATDPTRNRVTVGARGELARRAVPVRDARLYRAHSRVNRVRLRYHSAPIPCSVSSPARAPGRLELALQEPAYGVAPGQTACLMDGDLVVGRATIAA